MSVEDELQLHVRLKAHIAEAAKAVRAIDDIKDETKELSRATNKVNTEFSELLGTLKIGAGLSGSFLAVQGVTELLGFMSRGIQLGIEWNATLETTQQGFEVLLGDAEKAQKRVDELIEFTSKTPFQQADVLNANRQLEALTNGALSTAEGMLLVGDAAAASNKSLQETSMWVGRLYAGLQTGTPVGEATLRLVEMGLIGGDVAQELNAMTDEALSNAEAMEVLQNVFGNSAGAMQKQSETLNGMLSTLRDTLGEIAGDATLPLFDAMKGSLRDLLVILGKIDTKAEGYIKTLSEIPEATKAAAMENQMVGGRDLSWLDGANEKYEQLVALKERAAGISLPETEEHKVSYGPNGQMVKTRNLNSVADWDGFRASVMEAFPEAFEEAEDITYSSWKQFLDDLGALVEQQGSEIQVGQAFVGDISALNVDELEALKGSLQGKTGGADVRELELIEERLQSIQSRNLELEALLPRLRKEYQEQNLTLENQLSLLDQKIQKASEELRNLDASNMTQQAEDAAVLQLVIKLNELAAEREKLEKKITAEKEKQQRSIDREIAQQAKQLEQLRTYLETEEESIESSYQRRREIILSNTQATEEERAELMNKLEIDRSERIAALDQARWQTATAMFGDFQTNLLVAAQTGNRELVGIYKTAAIAVAIMQTYQAAQSSYSAMASIPYIGPALGVAAAAAAVVAGMARVSAIQQQGFADGGYTGFGGKYEYAGPAHKGEIVWSQEDIRRAGGVGTVEHMRVNAGRLPQNSARSNFAAGKNLLRSGNGSGGDQPQPIFRFANFNDELSAKDWLQSEDGQAFLIDFNKQNFL